MNAVSAREAPAQPAARPWLERLYGALPLLTVFFWLCLVYAWESWGHKTPWLFGDELGLAQLSRAISATGHAARRGDPHSFQTLYAFLLAPAWWIDDMSKAYGAVKYIGVVTMTSVLFPTYFLARMLVSPRAALFAGAAAASVPALAYSSMLIQEPLAYPYAALCFLLIAKALAVRSRGWIAGGVIASAVAPFVRGELALIPVVFLLAALGLAWTSGKARRWRAGWSAWDWVGAVVLGVGALVVVSTVIGSQSRTWLVATGHYRGRMVEYGLWAAGALTIGLGILPVVAGLAALVRRRSEPATDAFRAFVAVCVAALVCFGLYTAAKASYLSTVFATRVEERNLIYLCPLLLVGTAIWLERRRLRLVPLLCATGLAAYLIVAAHPYQMQVKLYSDALGFSILQMANRELGFTPGIAEWTLFAVLGISFALLVAPRLLARHARAAAGALVLTATLVVGWNLAGQISAGRASNTFSQQFADNLPSPPDWVDRVTKGAPTMYLGQNINDPNGVWLLEFWNRSIHYVWSLDGTGPGPGPTVTPNVDALDGHLQQQQGDVKYVVADEGIDVVGKVVATGSHVAAGQPALWRLFEIDYPVRLRHAAEGIYSDGWMGGRASYDQYSATGSKPGYVVVSLSRAGWGGPDVPGRVVIKVGKLALTPAQRPALSRITGVRTWTIRSHRSRIFAIPTPRPPFRVEVRISPTFVPAELDPRLGDRRQLGAVVGFGFSETRPSP